MKSDHKKREEIAVALGVENEMPAVLAVGRENLARDILKQARRYGVPVESHPALASALSTEAEGPVSEETKRHLGRILTKHMR